MQKKGNKVNKLASVFIFLMMLGISLPSPAWAGYTYTEIIPPAWTEAYALAINDGGDVVGWGSDANNIEKGFLYSGGIYTEIMPSDWLWAEALGINNGGDIVGWGSDANVVVKGFLYSGGIYTEIMPSAWTEAYAYAINYSGDIVGGGADANGWKGFIATLQSECSTWPEVISKYNAYVSGQSSWSDVIECYNEYVSHQQ